MSKQAQRQNQLVQIIKTQGMLPAKTLAAILEVSEMTVRRDLRALQQQPAAEQKNGLPAARGAAGGRDEYNLWHALTEFNGQKNRIGEFAASLIEMNDVIVIDTGSTTARILPHIPKNKNVTVLCYNANVMLELHNKPGIQLLFCGGVFHPATEMFESPEGIQFIERTRANKVFLSAAGVHEELGITCVNSYEVPTKNAVVRSSLERILVLDSSKFDQLRPAFFCTLDEINTIVTDKNIPSRWRSLIERKGIALHLV